MSAAKAAMVAAFNALAAAFETYPSKVLMREEVADIIRAAAKKIGEES